MDDKRLKKISKKELLEILLAQAKKIEELETELKEVKEELNSRRIEIKKSGSIAEAALKLNGIFELAQKTADEYVENVKERCKQLEEKKKSPKNTNKREVKQNNEVIVDKVIVNPKGKILKSKVIKRVIKNEKNKK